MIVFYSLTYAICWLYSCHKPKRVTVECNNTFIVHVVGVIEYFGVNIRETGTANELGWSSQRPQKTVRSPRQLSQTNTIIWSNGRTADH